MDHVVEESADLPISDVDRSGFAEIRAGSYLDAFRRMIAGDDSGADDLLRLHEADPVDPILALHARRIRSGERSARMAT